MSIPQSIADAYSAHQETLGLLGDAITSAFPDPIPSCIEVTNLQMPEGNANLRATGYDSEAGQHEFNWTCDRGYINTPSLDNCQWAANEMGPNGWEPLPSGTYTITLEIRLNSSVIAISNLVLALSREGSLVILAE